MISIVIYYINNIALFIIIVVLWVWVINEDRVYQNKNKIYKILDKKLEFETNK